VGKPPLNSLLPLRAGARLRRGAAGFRRPQPQPPELLRAGAQSAAEGNAIGAFLLSAGLCAPCHRATGQACRATGPPRKLSLYRERLPNRLALPKPNSPVSALQTPARGRGARRASPHVSPGSRATGPPGNLAGPLATAQACHRATGPPGRLAGPPGHKLPPYRKRLPNRRHWRPPPARRAATLALVIPCPYAKSAAWRNCHAALAVAVAGLVHRATPEL